MAFDVPSTASTTWTGATSVTITKPTGLTAGDLMVAVIASISTEVDGLAGFTVRAQSNATGTGITLLEKIADAGDVAASDFTFSATGAGDIAGAIIRATGGTAVPFDFADGEEALNQSPDVATFAFSVSDTPDQNGSLLVMGIMGFGTDVVGDIATYTINGSNPTWTEVCDFSKDIGSTDPIFGVAYAIQTTAAAITSYQATVSTVKDDWAGVFAAFTPLINASTSPAVVTMAANIIAPAATGTAVTSPAVVGLTASINAPSATGDSPKWVNPDKSTAPTWVNPDKTP